MSDHMLLDDLVAGLRCGNEDAAAEVLKRYSKRLAAVAEPLLNQSAKKAVGAEAVVQSVLGTFLKHARNGRFRIDHSGALWRLLVKITYRRVWKVNGRFKLPPIPLDHPNPYPSPQDVLVLKDLIEQLVEKFPPREQRILELKFQGHTSARLPRRLGVAEQPYGGLSNVPELSSKGC